MKIVVFGATGIIGKAVAGGVGIVALLAIVAGGLGFGITLISEKARATIERDDEVDTLHDFFYSELIAAISRDSSLVQRGVQWLFVIKHLERIADYVTNICEQIIYMSRGQVITSRELPFGDHGDPFGPGPVPAMHGRANGNGTQPPH